MTQHEHTFEASRPMTCPRCGAPYDEVEPGDEGNMHVGPPPVPDRYYFACGHSVYENYRDGERVWQEVDAKLAPDCPGRKQQLEPCPDCAINRGAVKCLKCGREWPPHAEQQLATCPTRPACDGTVVERVRASHAVYADGSTSPEPIHEPETVDWYCTTCGARTHDPRNWGIGGEHGCGVDPPILPADVVSNIDSAVRDAQRRGDVMAGAREAERLAREATGDPWVFVLLEGGGTALVIPPDA